MFTVIDGAVFTVSDDLMDSGAERGVARPLARQAAPPLLRFATARVRSSTWQPQGSVSRACSGQLKGGGRPHGGLRLRAAGVSPQSQRIAENWLSSFFVLKKTGLLVVRGKLGSEGGGAWGSIGEPEAGDRENSPANHVMPTCARSFSAAY